MSTQQYTATELQQELDQSSQKSQSELEKNVAKRIDCYPNLCYNSGLTTQRG
jgi:hypothetical protein